MAQTKRVGVIIPTWQAGEDFALLMQDLAKQTVSFTRKLIIDSSSPDGTVKEAKNFGWETMVIPKESFSHGGSRALAFTQVADDVDFVLFLTQDVKIPDASAVEKLLAAFDDEKVGAAYGRQTASDGADEAAKLQREFSYPNKSRKKTLLDREKLGLKAPFISNSFAMYRVSALQSVGNFPPVNICEDVLTGVNLLRAGFTIAYEADAIVKHSHNFKWKETVSRYQAIGRFYAEEKELFQQFGQSESEGIKLLCYQLKKATKENGFLSVAKLLFQNAVKYAAYKKGYLSI